MSARHISCSGPCSGGTRPCPTPMACQLPDVRQRHARRERGQVRLVALVWVALVLAVLGIVALAHAALESGAA